MSATKIVMGTAQKQNISVQHRYFNKYSSPVKFLNFENWFTWTTEKMTSKGAKVEIFGEIVFITWPGQKVVGFSILEFLDEYKTKYLRQKRG